MKTKAAVLYEHNKPLVVEEVDLDAPKTGEVLVRVGAAGICRSDLHFIHGEEYIKLPAVLGHEGAGIVEQVGEGVTLVEAGDHVIFSFAPNCGQCRSCVSGKANLCDAHGATTGTLFDGTTRLHTKDTRITHMGKVACFSEYSVVPQWGCIPIPKNIGLGQAALIGCSVTTGVGAVLCTAPVEPGSTVAVIGCGGVGINVIQGASLVSASKIIAIDTEETALEYALKFGATDIINAKTEEPVEKVRELPGGVGVDFSFEVRGLPETVRQSYEMIRKAGTAVIVGIGETGITADIDLVSLVRQEKTLTGTYYGSAKPRNDFNRMVDLYLNNKLNIDDLITREYSLDQINEAFAALERGDPGRGIIRYHQDV